MNMHTYSIYTYSKTTELKSLIKKTVCTPKY